MTPIPALTPGVLSFHSGDIKNPRLGAYVPDIMRDSKHCSYLFFHTVFQGHPRNIDRENSSIYIKFNDNYCFTVSGGYPNPLPTKHNAEKVTKWAEKQFKERDITNDFHLEPSVLDITPLFGLSDEQAMEALSQLGEEQLSEIKHLMLPPVVNLGEMSLHSLANCLIFFAQRGNLEVRFHNVEYVNFPPTEYFKPIVTHMKESLSKEQLNFALDQFLPHVLLKGKHQKGLNITPPSVDLLKQSFYDNEERGTDLTVKLDRKEVKVHRATLAMHSNMLNKLLFSSFKEGCENEVSFGDHPDEVVEQFLKSCYGFTPEFSECRFFDLLNFANYCDSSHFTELVNAHFDRSDKPVELLCVMIDLALWKNLPNKNQFFRSVGKNWDTIMKTIPILREEFIKAWLA